MKIAGAGGELLKLDLGKRDLALLLQVLQCYPVLPLSHQRLTRGGKVPDSAEAQRLLEESLGDHRKDSKRLVQSWIDQARKARREPGATAIELSRGQFEILLQVLNDVRVGSWMSLGCPERQIKRIDEDTAPQVWAMEIAGYLQMGLLHALESSGTA